MLPGRPRRRSQRRNTRNRRRRLLLRRCRVIIQGCRAHSAVPIVTRHPAVSKRSVSAATLFGLFQRECAWRPVRLVRPAATATGATPFPLILRHRVPCPLVVGPQVDVRAHRRGSRASTAPFDTGTVMVLAGLHCGPLPPSASLLASETALA